MPERADAEDEGGRMKLIFTQFRGIYNTGTLFRHEALLTA